MPDLLYQAGQLLPSSSAVDGFIRIRSMGATLVDVLPEIRRLLILTMIYGGLAMFGIHRMLCRACDDRKAEV